MKGEKEMLSLRDYKSAVKKYESENLSSNNVYTFLSKQELDLVSHYYRAYTVELFRRLRGSLRLNVSESKVKELVALKGNGVWDFAGMVDTGKLGNAHCELGHALRYCYYARNLSNGSYLKFGYTCVSDFFDVDQKGVNDLKKIKDTMISELKTIIAVRNLGLIEEHIKYDLGVYGRLYKRVGLNGLKQINHNKRYIYAMSFLYNGLGIPKSLVSFLNEDNNLESLVTPSLLGMTAYEEKSKSILGIVSYGFEDLCDTEVLKIINPDKAKYGGSRLNKYISFKDIKKWDKREKDLLEVYSIYEKEGIFDWLKMYRESKYYVQKDEVKNKDIINLGGNLLNAFSKNGNVVLNLDCVSTNYPYTVNGEHILKKAIKNMDYLITQLKQDTVVSDFKGLKAYIDEKEAKALASLTEEEKIIRYMRVNLEKDKYAVIGKGIEISKDIIFKKGKNLTNMSEPQKNVVLRVYNAMLKVDGVDVKGNEKDVTPTKSTDNVVYYLEDNVDILKRIQGVINHPKWGSLGDKQKAIITTVLREGKVSTKQLSIIDSIINSLNSVVYVLDERPDIKDKMTKVINSELFKDLDSFTKKVLNTVLQKGVCSEKQLTYIDRAYAKLPDTLKNTTDNKRYNLDDRPDLKELVLSLKNRDDLEGKVADILSNVLEYNSVTDRQLKHLNMAYMSGVLNS